MDFASRLQMLVYSDKLTSGELSVARALSLYPNLVDFLKVVEKAELVIVLPKEVSELISREVGALFGCELAILPVQLQQVLSTLPVETAKFTADNVCRLLKEVFKGVIINLKGVISISAGVCLNDVSAPGLMFWHLIDCSFIRFLIRSLELVLSVAFVDYATMSVSLKTDRVGCSIDSAFFSPKELMGKIKEMIENRSINLDIMARTCIGGALPEAYQRQYLIDLSPSPMI